MLQKCSQEDLGKWIWIANPDPIPNSYIQARKTFALDRTPTSALIKISADSRYKLFINGCYVGKGPVRSAEGQCYVDNYDITALLKKGNNVVAAIVHHIGENTYAYSAGKPGLMCKVEITTDKGPQAFGTDETWRVRRATEWTTSGARMSHRLGFQEVYDAGNANENWNKVRYSEKGWEYASVVGIPPAQPWGEAIPRLTPPLQEEIVLAHAVIGTHNGAEISKETPVASVPAIMADTELAALKSGEVKDAEALCFADGQSHVRTPRGDKGVVIVLDFGREVFGNVEIGLTGSSGCIDIGYSELLLEGRVKPNRHGTNYTDRIQLKRGRLEWQSFEPRAFRYMQIEFRRCTRPLAIDYVRVNQTTYPVNQTGRFECSDRLINQIWQAGVYTAQLCMEDTFIDCPWRERGQWWGDARILSRTAYYAFDDTALLAQGLRQFASAQTDDGAIPGLYPPGDMAIAPDFALMWVFSVLDYYAFSDDAELVRELYPAVSKMLEWFAGYANDSGMLNEVPGRLLIDRADLERRGEVTSLNCFYHQALRVASALAFISGQDEEAQSYLDTSNRLKVALNKYMYDPKRGLYAECRVDDRLVEKFSRQTNILAALFDIADQYQKAGILRQIGNGNLPELGTPYFASYYLEALYSADRHADALNYIRRKWGRMIEAGATTLWEDFDTDTQGALCHASAVCPTRDLIAEFVGIKPVPGANRFAVTPHPGDLKWAAAAVETRSGRLTVEWRVLRDRLDIKVDAPHGLKVDVYPPGPIDSTIMVDGKHWHSRFVTLSDGTHLIRVVQPKLQKIVTYDESESTLMPHVEVLDKGIRIGRRGIAIETRRRSKRSSKPDETIEVRMDAATVVEHTDTPQKVETQPIEPTEDATKKRRRRSRGGKGRRKSSATTEIQAVEVVQEESPIAEPEPQPESTEEAPATKRRRRSRGGRGRRKSSTPTEVQAVESANEESAVAQPEPSPEAIEPQQAETPVEQAPAAKRRRGSRGGRGRKRSTTPPETEKTEESGIDASQHQPEQSPEIAPQSDIPADVPVEQPKKRRRTYTRRRSATSAKTNEESSEGEAK